MNIRVSDLSGIRRVLSGWDILPAILKILSTGADDAGIIHVNKKASIRW